MKPVKLVRFFARLEPYAVHEENAVLLDEVSELLYTTTRYARTLLGDMQKNDWLQWTPKTGRNQRSILKKLYSEADIRRQIALDFISQKQFEEALEVLQDNQQLFGELLKQSSGAGLYNGQLHVQLTYNRTFGALYPHNILRNSERFFVRQLYSCLVKQDAKGNISPDIAHHWQMSEDGKQWSLYLRPKVQFHDGSPIHGQAIVELFNAYRKLPGYKKDLSHLLRVESPQSRVVRFYLSTEDVDFVSKLSDVKYSIQPVNQVTKSITKQKDVIGSGPFTLLEQSDKWLKLRAYEAFHGYRSLTDELTVWHVQSENGGNSYSHKMLSQQTEDDAKSAAAPTKQLCVEDGCLLAVFNQNASKELPTETRRWLAHVIQGEALWQDIEKNKVPINLVAADNFYPFWKPWECVAGTKPTAFRGLSILIYNHFGLRVCAQAISNVLAKYDIEVDIEEVPIETYAKRAKGDGFTQDIVLMNLLLDDNLPTSALLAFQSDIALRSCMNDKTSQWLDSNLTALCSKVQSTHYLERLEPIGNYLISEVIAKPLFHHMQSMSFQDMFHGVDMTPWGWPDIQQIWLED
ncbi:SgrR family transcriptional regulator [Vibrio comitans]|uniref:Transporter n=1 Tax=Vibrio comitans NBRC 102076 TaxID=1219078 RepID=A0A4Y3IJZ1_9VIBR|nr:SgrR family transcriptional regulator [Vibrio comitans]GEA59829.1 transporter [Vibrio comitans NBRC 102076]